MYELNPAGRRRAARHGHSLVRYGQALGLAAVVGLVAGAAQAELVIVDGATSLESLSGQSTAQRQMGVSIDDVCPTLVANRSAISGDTRDLQEVCTRMIQSANEVLGSGATGESFGLGEDELNGALQQINGEEANAPREQISEVGDGLGTALGGRMAALRQGARGVQVVLHGLDPLIERQYALGGSFSDTQTAQDDADFSSLVPDWGVWLTGNFGFGDMDSTSTSTGFDFNSYGGVGGVDYRFTDNFIAGLAFGINFFDADFDSSASSASGQELNSHAYSVAGYGTWYIGDSLYLEGTAGFSYMNYDSKRRIVINSTTAAPSVNREANGDFDGYQFSASGGVGYSVPIDGFDLTPYARGSFTHASIDGYRENGAWGLDLRFSDQDIESFTTTVGVLGSKAISTNFGVLVPSIWGEYIHEFLNNNDGSTVSYVHDPTGLSSFTAANEDPDRDYFQVGAGMTAVLPGGWSPFANFQSILGLEDLNSYLFTVGVRKEL